MRTVLGVLAIVFGVAGVLCAVVAPVLIWQAAAEVAERTNKVTTQAAGSLTRVEETLQILEEKVATTVAAVEKVRESSRRIADGTAKDDPALAAEIQRLLDTLAPLLERSASIGESLQSFAGLIENVAGLSAQLGKDSSHAEQMRAVAATMREVAETLGTIRQGAANLQRGEAVPAAGKLADLAARARPPLERLVEGLAEVRGRCEGMRADLAEVKAEVDFWTVTGPILLSLFLVWFALGQLCLIGWGRRRFAAASAG